MIEFTYTELFLLCWAVLATGASFYFYERDRGHGWFVKALIENKELRADFFHKMDTHVEEKP